MTSGKIKILSTPVSPLSGGVLVAFALLMTVYLSAGIFVMDYHQKRSEQSLSSLGFGYGVLIEAIEKTGVYRVPAGVHHPEVSFSAHRLPFIPYFLLGVKYIVGDNLRWIALVKCMLFGAIFLMSLITVLRNTSVPFGRFLLSLGIALTMPKWVLNFFEIGLEEAYNIPLISLLFALIWFSRNRSVVWAVMIGLILVWLLYIKSSMLYWCLATPILLWWRDRDLRTAAPIGGLVLAGVISLAFFQQKNSGKFTVGSSWEGWTLYKGNCEYSKDLYPPYSLDILDYEGKVRGDRPLRDEWDYNEYFREKAKDFILNNPVEFLQLALRKAWVFYGEVRASGLSVRSESRYGRPEYLISIPWMILFRAMLWIAIGHALVAVWKPKTKNEVWTASTYLVFLFLYSGFHVIGFAYERHVMPTVIPTVWYLCWTWGQNKTNKSFQETENPAG